MPELPDVQVHGEYLDATSLHRRIERARVDAARELRGVSARSLASTLRGRTLEETHRHGKHLFVRLGGDPRRWLRLHFGMTGYLRAWDGEGVRSDADHVRLLLVFADARRLAYVCVRRFGELGLTEDPADTLEERGLGPDALDVGRSELVRRLRDRRGGVKSALMDQGLVAGLGNIYTDEILFQAEVHPGARTSRLTDDDIRRIRRVTRRVLGRAIASRADPARMPRSWLLPRREVGRTCPRCGGTIERTEVAGRSSYLCSGHQARPGR